MNDKRMLKITNADVSNRNDMIREKMKEQDTLEHVATSDSRVLTRNKLTSLGYAPDDVQADRQFDVEVDGVTESVRMDYHVSVDGMPFMAVMCTMAVESRERHVMFLSRVAGPIPFALVTDGIKAIFIDALRSEVIGRSWDEVPTRERASELLAGIEMPPIDAKRLVMEKRALMAFQSTFCPRAKEDDSKR